MHDCPCPHTARGQREKKDLQKNLTSSASPSLCLLCQKKRRISLICLSVCLSAVPMIHWTKAVISFSFPCINIHGVLCIDHLCFNVGVRRAGYRSMPGFINQNFFWLSYISSFVHTQTFSVDSTHTFMNKAPEQDYHSETTPSLQILNNS